jgi:hypothetical protein
MGKNHQELKLGGIERRKYADDDVLFFISGKKLYEIGEQSGKYPPLGWRRPGFLAGKRLSEIGPEDPRRPQSAAHLLREMGGIWAHPVKAVESLYFSIESQNERYMLTSSDRFTYYFSHAQLSYSRGNFDITRTDFVHEDEPALYIDFAIRNKGNSTSRIKLLLDVEFNLMPSWFSGWPNGIDQVFYQNGLLFAYDYDQYRPVQWGAVLGSALMPVKHERRTIDDPKVRGESKKVSTLTYELDIEAGQTVTVPFLLSVANTGGYPAAHDRFLSLAHKGEEVLNHKVSQLEHAVLSGVQFDCSDKWFSEAYTLAKANLLILMADLKPFLGPYLYAGIPEYVQLFGTDTTYSIPGIVACGFREVAKGALSQLGSFATMLCGRVPHEITTNGHIFHPGNTQETPQFAIACWDYFRWTGDKNFLEWVYPICQEGVLDYAPAHWDMDLDYYLDGNGVVERPGMGEEKLDSVCYFCRSIFVLAKMAEVLGWTNESARYLELAVTLKEAINEDWWIESESLFADSLDEDHTPRMDGHWTVAVPMEADIAHRDKGAQALRRIEKDWVNEWGLVHTRTKEELVWTLPTGVLAMAEFNYDNPDTGTWLLRQIAVTMDHGALGTFKELIPEGLSFIQLWSPAMFLQGLIEGTLAISPRADLHKVSVRPKLPTEWTYARVTNLSVGNHILSVHLDEGRQGIPHKATVQHHSGDAPLQFELDLRVSGALPVVAPDGFSITKSFEVTSEDNFMHLEFTVNTLQEVVVTLTEQQITVTPAGLACPPS